MVQEFSLQKEKHKKFAREMAGKYNIPEDLFLGQLEQESNWNPKAVSSAGAKGIGQFMPNIHKLGSWKFRSKEDYLDPHKSIESAAMYMNSLNNQYEGNYMAALAHYNGGGRQGQLVAKGGTPNYSETAKYIQIIPQKAQKYQTGPVVEAFNAAQAVVENDPIEAANVAANVVANQVPQEQPTNTPDPRQESIKNITDYFMQASGSPEQRAPIPQNNSYTPDPETEQRMSELEAILSQRKQQDLETNMQSLLHQQQMNQQRQSQDRQANIYNFAQQIGSMTPGVQTSPQVPDLKYTQNQSQIPQVRMSQTNPWKGTERRL